MSRYRFSVTGIEYRPHPTTLVHLFEHSDEIEAEHVGHVVELLGAIPNPVDWSMVDTNHAVTIEIEPIEEETS